MKKQNLPQQQQQDDPAQAKMKKKEVQGVETAVVSPYPALQRAYADPASITPKDARILQRTIGNQAVRRLVIQRKMTVGPVGDKYEQEADAVAKQVVNQIHSPQTSSTVPLAQRQEDEEDVQMKPLLQRQEEEEDVQMKPQLVQRNSADGFETDDTFESSLSRQRGSGNPLPATLRTNFEPKFGADFSGVKVHTNDQSHKLNQSIQAKAFTTGQDIFFRQGAYEPSSRGGQELIAHELTHVVQQNGATVQRAWQSESQADPFKTGTHIQRALAPIGGKSSSVFGGDRTTINKLVAKYNALEQKEAEAQTPIAQSTPVLLEKVEEIRRKAETWWTSVNKKNKFAKAHEISDWIDKEVDRELAQIKKRKDESKPKEGQSLIAGFGLHWFTDSSLSSVYKEYLTTKQYEGTTVSALEEVLTYKESPNRNEALRIYDKYAMGTSEQLNITGEGGGGKEAAQAFRAEFEAFRADVNAPIPADFGTAEKDLVFVINEMFVSFTKSEEYKKLTAEEKS